jgi:RNA polymerase sigma-70 factor (ECF subfamily)
MIRHWTFRTYYRQYADLVFTHARYCLHNSAEAEDVMQDVFTRLWEHIADVREDGVRAWLLTLTHRRCIDVIRNRKSRVTESNGGESPDEAAARQPDTDQLEAWLEHRDLLDRVHTQLAALPTDQRSVILLRCREGFSYAEIAEALSLSIDNVKVLLHRGRKTLRRRVLEVPVHE